MRAFTLHLVERMGGIMRKARFNTETAHPKIVYCMSRWGAGPKRMLKDDFPVFGSECRPIDRIPRLSCFTSGKTSSGTDLSPSSCAFPAEE